MGCFCFFRCSLAKPVYDQYITCTVMFGRIWCRILPHFRSSFRSSMCECPIMFLPGHFSWTLSWPHDQRNLPGTVLEMTSCSNVNNYLRYSTTWSAFALMINFITFIFFPFPNWLDLSFHSPCSLHYMHFLCVIFSARLFLLCMLCRLKMMVKNID